MKIENHVYIKAPDLLGNVESLQDFVRQMQSLEHALSGGLIAPAQILSRNRHSDDNTAAGPRAVGGLGSPEGDPAPNSQPPQDREASIGSLLGVNVRGSERPSSSSRESRVFSGFPFACALQRAPAALMTVLSLVERDFTSDDYSLLCMLDDVNCDNRYGCYESD